MAAQREWYEKDYYQVLGVTKEATPKEITKAYRKLARDSHPDTHPGDAAAEERFKEVSAAYDVLGDESKRKEYDEVRALGGGNPFGGGFNPTSGPGGFNGQTFDFNVGADGLGDVLGQMFGRGRRGGGGSASAGPQRGGDLEASLTLDFADAVHGITTTLHLTSDAQCTTCNGSGAKPGTQPKVCSQCGGRGVIDDNQGLFSFSSPCRACGGAGVVVEDACPTCRGTGVEHRPRDVQVRIPAGVADGQRIRLKGRGAPGRNGGPAGDLFVECHVTPHRIFGRDGDNLTVRVPITFAEAALGCHRRGADARRRPREAAPEGRHAGWFAPPRAAQGHRDQAGPRRPDRHGRRAGAQRAHRRAAPGGRGVGRGHPHLAARRVVRRGRRMTGR